METSEERELIEALSHEEYLPLGEKEVGETIVRDIVEETPLKEAPESEFESLTEEVTHAEMPDISTETVVRPAVEEVEERAQTELDRTTVEMEHRTGPKDESVTVVTISREDVVIPCKTEVGETIVRDIVEETPLRETPEADRKHMGLISVTRFDPEFIASVVASSADVVHEGNQPDSC